MDARVPEIERLLFVEGMTLEEVGAIYGVSRERIRQLSPRPVKGNPALKKRRVREWVSRLHAAAPKMVDLYKSGTNIHGIARETGFSTSAVSQVLEMELGEAWMKYLPRGPFTVFVQADARAALAACAKEFGHTPSVHEYRDWATERSGVPSFATVVPHLYERWFDALVDAGLQPWRARNRQPRKDLIPYEDCLAAVESLWNLLGYPPSTTEYERHSRELCLPSLATVRNRAPKRSWRLLICELAERRRG